MPITKKKPTDMVTAVLDQAIPWPHRHHMLMAMLTDPEKHESLQALLAAAANAKQDDVMAAKIQQLNEMIASLEEGALRTGTFMGWAVPRKGIKRAQVKTADGNGALFVVPDDEVAGQLRIGEDVLLDGRQRAVIGAESGELPTGEMARLVRRVEGLVVEIAFPRDEESLLFVASETLGEKMDRGEVMPGATLRVCRRRGVAFDVVPQPDGVSHYNYVCREPVPDVVLGRDLGAAPKYATRALEHARRYMTQGEVLQQYHIRPCISWMLIGPSGTGKTFSILAVWNGLYRLMSELTGVPVEELPPRVMRLRLSQVLSKWLGESDKRLSRFFDEAEQLAQEKFTTPDGREFDLPVMIVFEECEGLARQRGSDNDAIYDRIQTTLLQRLDNTSSKLRDRLIIALFSTNVPWLLDAATARRFGDNVEHFGRLNRPAFRDILRKHLRGLPIQTHNGTSQEGLERSLAEQVTTWLYAPNASAEQGVVELTYAGDANPVTRRMSEFLTPALVERAVQQASARAVDLQIAGQGRPGLSAALLAECIEQQIRAIVERLRRENVADYLDLPEGARSVANLRRLNRAAAALPLQWLRDDL